MKSGLVSRQVRSAAADLAFAVMPHHPDRLRRPAGTSAPLTDAVEQALTWNIFRTLELLPPAFWLRRLRARLQDTSAGTPAPTVGRVALWPALSPSPAEAMAGNTRAVVPDVVIETEFTIWALVTLFGRDVADGDERVPDPIARIIDAGSWHAGARDFCFGLIVRDPVHAPLAVSRVRHYARDRMHLANRLSGRGERLHNVRAIGVARWSDLGEILEDCAAADALTSIERMLAQHGLQSVSSIGTLSI